MNQDYIGAYIFAFFVTIALTGIGNAAINHIANHNSKKALFYIFNWLFVMKYYLTVAVNSYAGAFGLNREASEHLANLLKSPIIGAPILIPFSIFWVWKSTSISKKINKK